MMSSYAHHRDAQVDVFAVDCGGWEAFSKCSATYEMRNIKVSSGKSTGVYAVLLCQVSSVIKRASALTKEALLYQTKMSESSWRIRPGFEHSE